MVRRQFEGGYISRAASTEIDTYARVHEYARNMEQDFKGGGISRYSEISRKYGITVTYRGSTQVTKAKEALLSGPSTTLAKQLPHMKIIAKGP